MLKRLLAHPLTRDLDIDAPETTLLRRQIIQEKPFLKMIYREWYDFLMMALPGQISGPVLELGSGGGFLKQLMPSLLASDVLPLPFTDIVLDGCALPFPSASLRGIVMTNVFHHILDPCAFLRQTARCLRPGGVLAMIEPWVTPWSSWVYRHLHSEPFQPTAQPWELSPDVLHPQSGPLSGANNALPWIIFQRDRSRFEQLFPQLAVQEILPYMPFRYLISGGVSLRSLAPEWTFAGWQALEARLQPWMHHLAMFARILIQRKLADITA